MPHRMFTTRRSAARVFVLLLGGLALVMVPALWAQDSSKDSSNNSKPALSRPGAQDDARTNPSDEIHPLHADMIGDAKERVEVLDAQLAAKRSHIRLSEARLKQARDQLAFYQHKAKGSETDEEKMAMLRAEIPVLEAEAEAEHAEIREPEVLLKHAKSRVDELEQMARPATRTGLLSRWRNRAVGATGMPPFQHPSFMPMDHMAMGFHPMAVVDDKLDQLREAIEGLEQDVNSLRTKSQK